MIEALGLSELHKRFGIESVICLVLAVTFIGGGVSALSHEERIGFVPPLFLMGIGFVIMTALASRNYETGGKRGQTAELHRFRLRLMWRHQFQFIGVYRAEKLAGQNQSVKDTARTGKAPTIELIEGGSPIGLDPRATVFNGLDELGITSATALIQWYLKNRAAPESRQLVPLLVIFQRSPTCLIYRVQPALPKAGISALNLTGKRFRVLDLNDPAAMELRAMCGGHRIQNLQWDSTALYDSLNDDPISNLGQGGSADYRLGYSFNEGHRAVNSGKEGHTEYSFGLLADIFNRPELYGDVLFTRKELLDDPERKKDIASLVKNIEEGYGYFVDLNNHDRLTEVNELLERYCHDWWHKIKGAHPYDAPAQELIDLLTDSWGPPRQGKLLGERNCWKELEQAIYDDMHIRKPAKLPHFEWISAGATAASLR